MDAQRQGQVAVIFVSRRRGGGADDDADYARAAAAMDALAACQPGYRGVRSVRDAEGAGITVSYWSDEAAAHAWRDHAAHRTIREAGRERWYDTYEVVVARVERDYRWDRA